VWAFDDDSRLNLLIIDRYLAKEVVQTMLAVLLVLLLIFLGRFFAVYLSDALAGKISAAIVLDMLMLRTVTALSMMFPFALYMAVLLAFGRLYKDNEMTALAAGGVGMGRVLRTVLGLGLLLAALVSVLSLWTTPWAHESATRLQEETAATNAFAAVTAGRFSEVGDANRVFYVEALSEDRSELQDVFVADRRQGRLTLFSARAGYRYRDPDTGVLYLALVDGFRYEGRPGEVAFRIYRFDKHAVRLDEGEVKKMERRLWALPTGRLWGSTRLNEIAELQWRLAMPVATLLLAWLGALLSRTSPRQGRFGKLFVAILLFIIYYNTLGVAKNWIVRGVVPPELGLWWVHGVLLALLGWLTVRQIGARWLLDRLRGRVRLPGGAN